MTISNAISPAWFQHRLGTTRQSRQGTAPHGTAQRRI